MENRLRDKQINIRVTEYEYELIKARMKKSGASSLQKYIIDAATNGYLIHVDYSDIKALAYEINRVGNNINQIAHRRGSGKCRTYLEDDTGKVLSDTIMYLT